MFSSNGVIVADYDEYVYQNISTWKRPPDPDSFMLSLSNSVQVQLILHSLANIYLTKRTPH